MSDIVEWLREGYPATRPDRLLEAADEIVALRAKCIGILHRGQGQEGH